MIASLSLIGCGSGGSLHNAISLSIFPGSTKVAPGGQRGFLYTVQGAGSTQTGVSWSVKESGGGAIDSNGIYTAPNAPGIYHVLATSLSNSSVVAQSVVDVTTSGAILSVSQHQIVTAPGKLTPLGSYVSVSGSTNPIITWSVQSPNLGTVDAAGNYAAPGTPGDYYVTVSLASDPAQQDYILVEVTGVTLSITPTSVTLKKGMQHRFGYSIQVVGSTNNGVSWAVTDSQGNPVSNAGTIDAQGNYIAPAILGQFYVTVSSDVRPDVKATSTVTIIK